MPDHIYLSQDSGITFIHFLSLRDRWVVVNVAHIKMYYEESSRTCRVVLDWTKGGEPIGPVAKCSDTMFGAVLSMGVLDEDEE